MRNDFKYMPFHISKLAYKLNPKIGKLYDSLWNPINYAIVGGIGVLINYLFWFFLQMSFPWWITNAFAIGSAWLFNWSMSVGPFGWLWGFRERKK